MVKEKMNRELFVKQIERMQMVMEQEDALVELFNIGDNCLFVVSLRYLYDDHIRNLKCMVNDLEGLIEWFVFETAFGRKENKVEISNPETGNSEVFEIDSAEKLYDIIQDTFKMESKHEIRTPYKVRQ